MSNYTIWELIAKKLSGEASAEDLSQLEKLLKGNPEMHYPIETVADLWHHQTPDTEDAQLAFSRHASRMKEMGLEIEPASPLPLYEARKKKPIFFAAALLGITIIGYFSWTLLLSTDHNAKATAKTPAAISEVSTKYGSRAKQVLPDGTQVWLNSGSKLSYDKNYGNTIREVSLSGEAYFDVVKNAARPFVIHTNSIDIKVLGTAFNVKSFPGEKNTETSLIRGSIEVTFHNSPAKKIILKPNEKLITPNEEPSPATEKDPAGKDDQSTTKREVTHVVLPLISHLTYAPRDSTVIETSWMENKLIFRSETFEELAVKMERWYGVHIRFADEAIKPKKLNGIFENESIQQALKALQLITPFNFTINKDEILISSKT